MLRRVCAILILGATAWAAEELPNARKVVVRRTPSLTRALRAALPRGDLTGREVAVVVDVTPYTAAAEREMMHAFIDLQASAPGVLSWRLAPLGGKFTRPHASSHALAMELPRVLVQPTPSENTMLDLRKTLSGFSARRGVVIYLADWHFEDDHQLERLLGVLRSRSQVMSTVGSEAAFSRAWNDGFFPTRRRKSPRGGSGSYDLRIGRNPFGKNERNAPWHGGDTAYPHVPAYFGGTCWVSEFNVTDDSGEEAPRLEDLSERLRKSLERAKVRAGNHPLPSAYGPYGLMRLAAATGGRYVLWSWNPSGRTNVRYDYRRCDRLPPDLRPRRSILADAARRRLARALLDAWHNIANRRVALARTTPPLKTDRLTPQEMKTVRGAKCECLAFSDRDRLRTLLRDMPHVLAALDRSIRILDTAIDRAPPNPGDVDTRLLADAHLFRHVLRVQRFSLGEALEVAKAIPNSAWDHADKTPCVFPTEFLIRGADPKHVHPRTNRIFDGERGAQVTDDRRFMLTRYAGTPFGETVARNEVSAYRFGWGVKVPDDRGKGARTPAQSTQPAEPTTTPGGGSSPSPGPTTGG